MSVYFKEDYDTLYAAADMGWVYNLLASIDKSIAENFFDLMDPVIKEKVQKIAGFEKWGLDEFITGNGIPAIFHAAVDSAMEEKEAHIRIARAELRQDDEALERARGD